MKLQNLISKLEKHHKKKLDLSLGRTFNLLKKLGNPQDKLKNVITVVGTNAKASMCYSLKSILNKAGYKCNLYTSPHLLSYTERYIYNDSEIDEENLIDLLEDTERILGNWLEKNKSKRSDLIVATKISGKGYKNVRNGKGIYPKEVMQKDIVDACINFIDHNKVKSIDLTGGAPELNPHFRYLVRETRKIGADIIDRCNLTILFEHNQSEG